MGNEDEICSLALGAVLRASAFVPTAISVPVYASDAYEAASS